MKVETRAKLRRWHDKVLDGVHYLFMAGAFGLAVINSFQGDNVYSVALLGVAFGLLALRRQEKASATARELREAKELIKAMTVSGLAVGVVSDTKMLTDAQVEDLKRRFQFEGTRTSGRPPL